MIATVTVNFNQPLLLLLLNVLVPGLMLWKRLSKVEDHFWFMTVILGISAHYFLTKFTLGPAMTGLGWGFKTLNNEDTVSTFFNEADTPTSISNSFWLTMLVFCCAWCVFCLYSMFVSWVNVIVSLGIIASYVLNLNGFSRAYSVRNEARTEANKELLDDNKDV